MNHVAKRRAAVSLLSFLATACGGDNDATRVDADGGVDAAADAPSGSDSGDDLGSATAVGAWGKGRLISDDGTTWIETEPHIAADTAGTVVAAWFGAVSGQAILPIGYVVSHDHGASFGDVQLLYSPAGAGVADPVLASDGEGGFHLAWLATGDTEDDNVIDVATLDGATDTLGPPVAVSGAPAHVDKPWIVVAGDGAILVVWSDRTANTLMVATSRDGGLNFDRDSVGPSAGTNANLSSLCLDPSDGSSPIYIVYFELISTVHLVGSDDGGASWSELATPATDAVFQDPMCAARGDHVWVSYAEGDKLSVSTSETTPGDSVRVVHSHDRGETFNAAVVASDSAMGLQVLLPQLAITPSGAIELVYYQGEVNGPATLVHAESTDQGATFTRRDVAAPGTLVTSRNSAGWLGDYIGFASAGELLHVAYSDNSVAATNHIAFVATSPP